VEHKTIYWQNAVKLPVSNLPSSPAERAFEFLSERYQSQAFFTKDEFQDYSGWDPATFDSLFGNIFNPLLVAVGEDLFQVSEVFRRYSSLKRFQALLSKTPADLVNYTGYYYDDVIVFEFFMPLRNEAVLKSTLDALFYKDTILNRLRAAPEEALAAQFPMQPGEGEGDYFQRVCNWISTKFTGYSIGHFNGRFKGGRLKSFLEAAQLEQRANSYIEDETTAIVKFIFPCGTSQIKANYASLENDVADALAAAEDAGANEDQQAEARRIRFFFNLLFVKSILQVVSGEHSIWMLESGLRSRLHIWKVEAVKQ